MLPPFPHENRTQPLRIGQVLASEVVREFGTPLYVYDAESIRRRCQILKGAFASLRPHFHYSVKANGNLNLLKLLHQEGIGFDIVSGGELVRLQALRLPLSEVSFAGVGKTMTEIQMALSAGIGFFNVESGGELGRIATLAEAMERPARVLLRLNPNVDAQTHRYITTGKSTNKFGLSFETAADLLDHFEGHSWLDIVGFHVHIGSQIKQVAPYVDSLKAVLAFVDDQAACGHTVQYLNLGGGFGIAYQPGTETALPLTELGLALADLLEGRDLNIIFEPGRSLVASAGVLLTEVQYIKLSQDKTFVIVDSGMHHLIRPALYQGWHDIWPIDPPENLSEAELKLVDVVGPICESADFLAQNRNLPPVQAGDVLAVFDVGAYGFAMASTYNAQPRPAEVLVEGDAYRLVRRRETYADLLTEEVDLI